MQNAADISNQLNNLHMTIARQASQSRTALVFQEYLKLRSWSSEPNPDDDNQEINCFHMVP
jgi:hypothetical protein